MPPPPQGNLANLVSLKRHIHFGIFFVVFCKVFITQMSLGFSLLLLIHLFRSKQGDFFHCFYIMGISKNHE